MKIKQWRYTASVSLLLSDVGSIHYVCRSLCNKCHCVVRLLMTTIGRWRAYSRLCNIFVSVQTRYIVAVKLSGWWSSMNETLRSSRVPRNHRVPLLCDSAVNTSISCHSQTSGARRVLNLSSCSRGTRFHVTTANVSLRHFRWSTGARLWPLPRRFETPPREPRRATI